MQPKIGAATLTIVLGVIGVASVQVQDLLRAVMDRNGVQLPGGSIERAFDEGAAPSTAAGAGSLATPLALMTSGTGRDRINGAFAFGILAGRSGLAATPPELAAAGQILVQMIGSTDRRSRVAGARVAGRIFAVPFASPPAAPTVPGLSDALFVLLNQSHESEQLAAMDALGLMRLTDAITSLNERYEFYRAGNKRALAGGAIEALARIGAPSAVALVKTVSSEPWASGRDATALAVAFARERLLKDGSIGTIRLATEDRNLRTQAMGYLAELGFAGK